MLEIFFSLDFRERVYIELLNAFAARDNFNLATSTSTY